ncbi:MAG: hypothetical protein JWN68_1170, partial [Nocardioides sp.]|nr:hypothetical protein [Nocardioides sp.]
MTDPIGLADRSPQEVPDFDFARAEAAV